MELGKRIALRLKELGLTQVELARKSGLTQQVISQYIRGKSKPGYGAILGLSNGLGVTPAWFFEGSESKAPLYRLPSQERLPPSTSSAVNSDIIVFPKGKIERDATFVIGHYFPMLELPVPNQARNANIATSFYTLIFNSLVEYLPTFLPRAVLAIDWKIEKNRWLFWLRPDVRFHDGKPLTVEDVKWSYEQYLQGNPHEHCIEGVEIVDPHAVAIYIKFQSPLNHLAMPYILPEGLKSSPDGWVGTGPFQATELTPGFWKLRSNPHYFLGKPYLGELQICAYPDPHALEAALIYGEVHFAIGIDSPGERFAVKVEADVRRFHLHFLLKEPLVQNLVLRKAIALGLDREALAKAAGLKSPRYSSGPFDYLLKEHLSQPPLPPDADTAKQLLQSIKNLGDSVFRIKCYTGDSREPMLEEALIEQLSRLGIPTQAEKPPHAMLVNRSAASFEHEHRLWASTSSPAYNFGYSNPKVDDLIQQCRDSEPTPALLHQLRRLIQQDVPDIPLFYDETPITYVKRLQAVENRLTLLSSLNEIHTWYLLAEEIEVDKQKEEVA